MGILQNLQKFRVRYGSVTEFTEVPGIVARAYRTHTRYKNDIPVPRVFVALAYRTSGSSGYGYECLTELPEVPGTGMNVLCASSHGVCACDWCTAGDRTTTTVSRPMQPSNTHRRTSYQVYEAYSSSRSSSSYIHWNAYSCPPFLDSRCPGGYQVNPIPSLYYTCNTYEGDALIVFAALMQDLITTVGESFKVT